MIRLRSTMVKDAPLMLEWMQDNTIACVFHANMTEKSLKDAEEFCIEASALNSREIKDGMSVHFAIIETDNDEYLGTVSLKNIDRCSKGAEYAISTRKKVHGTGVAKIATDLILDKGFHELGLHRIFLNVLSTNTRAVKFYEKYGFIFEGESRDSVCKEGRFINLKWYSILDREFARMGGVLQ